MGKKGLQCRPVLLDTAVGDGIAGPFGCGNPRQSQLAQVARECCLRYVPATVKQQLSKVLLAAHRALVNDFENCRLPLSFVGHAGRYHLRTVDARGLGPGIDRASGSD